MSNALFGLKDHMHDPAIEEALTKPVRRSRLTSHEHESVKTSENEINLKAKYPIPGHIKPQAQSPATRLPMPMT